MISAMYIIAPHFGSLGLEVRFMEGAEEVEGDEAIIGIFVVINGAGYI